MRVEPLTDWPEHLQVGANVFVEGEDQERRIITAEWGGRVPALALEGIGSRDEAADSAGGGVVWLERESPARRGTGSGNRRTGGGALVEGTGRGLISWRPAASTGNRSFMKRN